MTSRPRRPAPPPATEQNGRVTQSRRPRGVRPGAPLPRRPQLPARPSRPVRDPAARDRARHGMSSRLFTEVRERRGLAYYVYGLNHSYTDAGSLYSQAGVDIGRIDEAVRRSRASCAGSPRSPPRGGAREGEGAREGPLRPPARDPAGADHVRPAREVLEGRGARSGGGARGLDAVTAEDVPRVAPDLIGGDGRDLAVIGPFDDAERFEPLLAPRNRLVHHSIGRG